MDAHTEPAQTGNVEKQPYATQDEAEKYIANWLLIRQLEKEQAELGEKLKLALLDGDEFNDGVYRLALTEPKETTFDKEKFIERFGKDQYILSSKLQVGLAKEHMTPAQYKALVEEGEVVTVTKGTPSLRVYPV